MICNEFREACIHPHTDAAVWGKAWLSDHNCKICNKKEAGHGLLVPPTSTAKYCSVP